MDGARLPYGRGSLHPRCRRADIQLSRRSSCRVIRLMVYLRAGGRVLDPRYVDRLGVRTQGDWGEEHVEQGQTGSSGEGLWVERADAEEGHVCALCADGAGRGFYLYCGAVCYY